MGWIKVELDEATHDELRDLVAQADMPTHDVAAKLLEQGMEQTQEHIKVLEAVNDE